MNEKTVNRIQHCCAWSGLAFVIFYGLSWVVLGHNYPPPNPKFTGAELVNNFYLPFRNNILLGQSLSTFFGMFYLTWTCQLTVQMWKREKTPILSLLNLTGGLLTAWVLSFGPVCWVLCAEFAGTIDPQIIKMVHFLGWYTYDMTYMITTIQGIAIFLFTLLDKKEPAIIPRWAGYLALFTALSFLPLTFLPYFKEGIFALNGYWSFHIAFGSYGLFTGVISYYMAKDLKRVKVRSAQSIGQANSRNYNN
ncbi:hypothetical protein [Clostridium felsineum]|uniref:hypothetical protein n=1 Tax=Clostridium felsineum TaxID=36839 RepID=UPI00098C7DC7|nr:hypothetical protein [Clostridium felsineum]URZ15821.1 hypothetical protein CLFE_018680 [Clostridium felsineum DSM 794]